MKSIELRQKFLKFFEEKGHKIIPSASLVPLENVEFLINFLKLDSKRIYVSVFAGDNDAPFDQESFEIWRKLGVNEDHIFKYGKSQNWWGPIGQTGPCGPDTEMFYDTQPFKGDSLKGGPAEDSERFVEILNDVFMQYD